ncbi:MAG: helix-turn-helix domain-containing protein, partial [Acidobacteria bacterium]|nr:helix-turn-helix domain-containing protein [Acidobacteriota bacterium]
MRDAVPKAQRTQQGRDPNPTTEPLKGSARLGDYLRHLRVGYGYSLRKVEERARVHGGEIDNSQLSRYEKGICYPSFDKLRTLARIFNVSIQTFSDVVDLEELEKHQPALDEPRTLMRGGHAEFELGDYGSAYAHYQKARMLVEREAGGDLGPDDVDLVAKARLASAITLFRMGKVSLCEYEVRQLLRLEAQLDVRLVVRALLQLSNAHVSLGDFMLAEIEARRSLELAVNAEDPILEAYAHHALGHILQDRGELERALEHQHEALDRYRAANDEHGALKVKLNLGSIYAARGQFKQGSRMLLDARDEAKRPRTPL